MAMANLHFNHINYTKLFYNNSKPSNTCHPFSTSSYSSTPYSKVNPPSLPSSALPSSLLLLSFYVLYNNNKDDKKQVSEEDVRYFESIMERKQIIREEESLREYNRDWTKRYKGSSPLALLPSSSSQLSSILSYCNSRKSSFPPPHLFIIIYYYLLSISHYWIHL